MPWRALRLRFTFDDASQGRQWLSGLIDKVGRGRSVDLAKPPDSRWVTVAFTWNGLRALGVDDASLATFPEEFRQGMVARAEVLGDTGANHPDHWVGGLARPDLHAIVDPFRAGRRRTRTMRRGNTQQYASQFPGVESALDTRPGGDTTVRPRARSLRLSRSTVTAGNRGNWRGADARLRRGR